MPERYLVTGGTGFTGSHLVRRLLTQGHTVTALDVRTGLFDDELRKLGAEIVIGSVTDREVVGKLASGCDVVFHLAAEFRNVNQPKQAYWDINVEGTRNVLDAARQEGARRVIYCSTCGVHGHVAKPPASENSPITPADYYQLTKYEGERVAQEFAQNGLSVSILRPTAIYGPGDPGRWLMLIRLVASGRFFMFGDGTASYHPVYIDNLLDAFELAAKGKARSNGTYLIGDERYYSLNDLVLTVAQALGVDLKVIHLPYAPLWLASFVTEMLFAPTKIEPPLFRRRVEWFKQNRAFDISRAQDDLGYDPRVELVEGLTETIRWYRQHGYMN